MNLSMYAFIGILLVLGGLVFGLQLIPRIREAQQHLQRARDEQDAFHPELHPVSYEETWERLLHSRTLLQDRYVEALLCAAAIGGGLFILWPMLNRLFG